MMKLKTYRPEKNNKSWSDQQTRTLIEEYPFVKDPRMLATKLEKSYEALKSRATLLHLKRKVRTQLGKTIALPQHDQFIKANYLEMGIKTMADHLPFSDTVVRKRMEVMGLIVPKVLKEKFRNTGAGKAPPNKGKKQTEFMTPEAIARCAVTRFKKGDTPGNTLYDGAIQIRHSHKERGCRPYKWIRIAKGKWKQLHVYNWEKEKGPVLKDHIIVFADGDTMNCSVSNLRMITRVQHAEETRNKDGYIAMTMAHEKGGRGKMNLRLYKKIFENKELIDLKRKQLELKRTINEQRRTNDVDQKCA